MADDTAKVVVMALAAGTAAAIAIGLFLWRYILEWARRSLLGWLERKKAFELVGLVKETYIVLDQLASYAREKAQYMLSSWKRLRKSLLKHSVELKYDETTKVVKQKTVSWVVDDTLEKGMVKRSTIEETVEWNKLPYHARIDLLETGVYEFDVTKTQDQQMKQLDLAQST